MFNGKARMFLWLLIVLMCTELSAQDRWQGDMYMVPPRVFVGDRASLVLSMPDLSYPANTEINLSQVPASPNIDIHRVVLERRSGGNRLTIDFSAYAPGILEMPPITIAGETISGITITISSILDLETTVMVLSGTALPLAIPGTSLLVYGTIGAFVLVLLLALWAMLWGRRQLKDWLELWKRKRLISAMWRIEKRLRKELLKGGTRREILDVLSGEFRTFLSYFYQMNCRAMTASEFTTNVFEPISSFPGIFFGRCDWMRFSGSEINEDETLALLGEIKSFLRELDRVMRPASSSAISAESNSPGGE